MEEEKEEMRLLVFWILFARIIVFLVVEAVLVWEVASLPWCILSGPGHTGQCGTGNGGVWIREVTSHTQGRKLQL